MASINKAFLIGNLGKDPDVRYMPGGRAVANVTLATHEGWTDKNTGEKQERTEWHHVVFYSPLAEIAGQYLRKGSQVFVEGRLQTRKWQDKNGQDRHTTEIVASEMKMLGARGETDPAPPRAAPAPVAPSPSRSRPATADGPATPAASRSTASPAPCGGDGYDDDIPFARPAALDGLPW